MKDQRNLPFKFILLTLLFFAALTWRAEAKAAQLTLTWKDNSSNEEGFKVERRIGSTFSEIATVEPNVNSYTDSGLADGTIYCYRVRMFNASGFSAYSNEACGSTPAPSIDTDGDGLWDNDEVNLYGTDPTLADTDGDGFSDGDEVNIYGSNPILADTDGDGISDGQEVNLGSDPLLANTNSNSISDSGEVNTYGSNARFLSADSTT